VILQRHEICILVVMSDRQTYNPGLPRRRSGPKRQAVCCVHLAGDPRRRERSVQVTMILNYFTELWRKLPRGRSNSGVCQGGVG
jgi:hypothetical protein